jgi:hypothetical protein
VVAVRILDATNDVRLKLLDERRLLVLRQTLERLLHDAAAVHLQAQGQNVALERVADQRALARRAVLEQLLHDVVAEHVLRQLERVRGHELAEHGLALLGARPLQLLLDEPRAMLVAAELGHVPDDILYQTHKKKKKKTSASAHHTTLDFRSESRALTLSSHLRDLFDRNSSSSSLRKCAPASSRRPPADRGACPNAAPGCMLCEPPRAWPYATAPPGIIIGTCPPYSRPGNACVCGDGVERSGEYSMFWWFICVVCCRLYCRRHNPKKIRR